MTRRVDPNINAQISSLPSESSRNTENNNLSDFLPRIPIKLCSPRPASTTNFTFFFKDYDSVEKLADNFTITNDIGSAEIYLDPTSPGKGHLILGKSIRLHTLATVFKDDQLGVHLANEDSIDQQFQDYFKTTSINRTEFLKEKYPGVHQALAMVVDKTVAHNLTVWNENQSLIENNQGDLEKAQKDLEEVKKAREIEIEQFVNDLKYGASLLQTIFSDLISSINENDMAPFASSFRRFAEAYNAIPPNVQAFNSDPLAKGISRVRKGDI